MKVWGVTLSNLTKNSFQTQNPKYVLIHKLVYVKYLYFLGLIAQFLLK
jgi:hypothetical protein